MKKNTIDIKKYKILSPVMADSSRAAFPSVMTPSAGRLSPALTIMTSPFTSSSAGISISFPSRMTRAVFGARSISFAIASEVFPFALASKNLPKLIRVSMVPALSKYISCIK